MFNFEDNYQRLKKTGKIKKGLTGKQIGRLIDFYNQTRETKITKGFRSEIVSKSKYYLPLLFYDIEEKRKGIKKPVYKTNSYLINLIKYI